MTIERGSATNGCWLVRRTLGAGTHRYRFEFDDSAGRSVVYPTTGSFEIAGAGGETEGRE